MKEPAVVIVTRGDVFPPRHGAAVKIERTAWAESFHARVVVLVTDDPRRYWVFRRGRREVRLFPGRLRKRLGADAPAILHAAGVPASEAFLYHALLDDGLTQRLDWIARRFCVDLFQAEFPAYARPCLEVRRRLGGRVLLVEHNVEFARLAAQHDLPVATRAWLRDIEVSLCNQADAVVTLSPLDRDALGAAGVTTPTHVVPPGVDLGAFTRARAIDLRALYGLPRGRPVLVFHGVYRYPPNLEAVGVLARAVLPRLRAAGRRVTVLAIGLDPPARSPHPDVRFVGPVRALASHLKSADLAVAFLGQGGGVRLKLLEYFAAGLPVVATSKAVEGLPVRHGTEAWVADRPDRFASAVLALLRDRPRAARLARHGRELARGYDWMTAGRRHLEAAGVLTPARDPAGETSVRPTSPRSARGSREKRGRTRPRPGA